MAHTAGDPFVERIAKAYLDGYDRQRAMAMKIVDELESPGGRVSLAKESAELAKQFEGHTRDERERRRERRVEQLAIAEAFRLVRTS